MFIGSSKLEVYFRKVEYPDGRDVEHLFHLFYAELDVKENTPTAHIAALSTLSLLLLYSYIICDRAGHHPTETTLTRAQAEERTRHHGHLE